MKETASLVREKTGVRLLQRVEVGHLIRQGIGVLAQKGKTCFTPSWTEIQNKKTAQGIKRKRGACVET